MCVCVLRISSSDTHYLALPGVNMTSAEERGLAVKHTLTDLNPSDRVWSLYTERGEDTHTPTV